MPHLPRLLAEATSTEVGDRRTLAVPVGSVEQHGPHLPLDTDSRIATAVAHRAFAANADVVIAPAVAFGASGEHEGFPGTLSIGHEALRAVLVELGRSASRWAHRILFVNGHGGNLPTVAEATAQLRVEGRDATWFGCTVPGADAHAGRTETAILLALDDSLVRTDVVTTGNTAPLRDILPMLMAGGTAAVSPNGVLGDPRGATAAEGEQFLRDMVRRLRDATARWQPDDRCHLT